jgi:Tfp pilus assembly protein PilX
MKIQFPKPAGERASALVVTMTLAVILLLVMASYLSLLTSQKTVVTRSQTWNAAMTMAEAGVEEAMAQLNQPASITFTGTNNASAMTNFSNNSWGGLGPTYGPKTNNNLLGGSYLTSFAAPMSTEGFVTNAIIDSIGYATVPVTGDTISRRVRLFAFTVPLLNVGAGAVSNISYTGGGNGNNIAVDSYDSYDTNHSINGQYPASNPSMTESNGNVASQYGFVNFANQQINGNLYLGPNASTSSSSTNNVTGSVDNNYNVQFPDVALPPGANSWTTASPTNAPVVSVDKKGVASTNYISGYYFPSGGNYIVNQDLPVVVEAGATVTLNVKSTTWSGSGMYLNGGMANSGTAILFFNGPSTITITGNTAVNPTSRPENLYYFGLPSLTSVTLSGTVSFVGVIYAPNVDLTLNGGGSSTDISGSVIVNSIQDKGHYNIHYDQALDRHGPTRGFVAYKWQEL